MAKQKAATKKVTKPTTPEKPKLIKVRMLHDMYFNGEDLECGSTQHLPAGVVGMWEHPSRRYCKRI